MAANILNFGDTESPITQSILGSDPVLAQKRLLAQLLMKQGMQEQPIKKHWAEAIPNAANKLLGAYLGRQSTDELQAQTNKYQTDMAAMLAGGQAGSWTNPDTGTAKEYGGGYEGMINAGMKTGNPALQGPIQTLQLEQGKNQAALKQAEAVARLKANAKANAPQIYKPGDILRDPDGTIAFQAPFKPEARKLLTPDEEAQQTRIRGSNQRPQPETFRLMTAEEAAAQGLAPGGVYQIGDRGNIKTVQKSAVGVEKVLPITYANKLTEKGEVVDTGGRLNEGFKDEFGGHTLAGDWSNTWGRLTGDDTGQAQWWQDYQFHTNEVRNKLFGSALTPTEAQQWDRANIDPRMNAVEIRKNLKRRQEIESIGLTRLMRGTAAGGYNKAQIEEFAGRSIPDAPTNNPGAPPSSPTAPTEIHYDQNGKRIP